MDLAESIKIVEYLINEKDISRLEIAQNLGVSLRCLDRFLKGNPHKNLQLNLPIYITELTKRKPFLYDDVKDFWNFIFTCTFHQSPTKPGERRVLIPRNPTSELALQAVASKYTRENLDMFENIYWWLIRKLAIHLFGKWSFQIDSRKAAQAICHGEKYYQKLMKMPSDQAKGLFRKLEPMSNLHLIFLKYDLPHEENVPFWLWETKAFPNLQFNMNGTNRFYEMIFKSFGFQNNGIPIC